MLRRVTLIAVAIVIAPSVSGTGASSDNPQETLVGYDGAPFGRYEWRLLPSDF